MGSTQSSFHARFVFWEDDFQIENIYCHEFGRSGCQSRHSEEWVRDALRDLHSAEDLREILELPKTGNYEVICKGIIRGWSSWTDIGEEWDEEIDFSEIESQIISDRGMGRGNRFLRN